MATKTKQTSSSSAPKTTSAFDKLRAAFDELMQYTKQFSVYVNRETEIKQLLYGLLCREHVLLKGLPGTAKSKLALAYLGNMKGAKIFKQQFTAFMDESYVFGPQNIEELKKGNIVHNVTNSLVDADFAFLDEYFNANEEMIVACNEALNERTFTRNQQFVKAPLIMAVMTTNQSREKEVKLKPIYDRIMFSAEVQRVSEPKDRMRLYDSYLRGDFDDIKPIEFSVVKDALEYIKTTKVSYPQYILSGFDILQSELQGTTGMYLSDRKVLKSLEILKVTALMSGRREVVADDLYSLSLSWLLGGDSKQVASFDAVFHKSKSEMDKLSKVQEHVNKADKLVKGILAKAEDASTPSDLKSLLSEIDEAERLIATFESEAKKVSKLDLFSKINSALMKLKGDTKDALTKLKSTDAVNAPAEDVEEDFEWFRNLSKIAQSDKPQKGTSSVDDVLSALSE